MIRRYSNINKKGGEGGGRLGETVAVTARDCGERGQPNCSNNNTLEAVKTRHETRILERKSTFSPTHCSKHFLPLKICDSHGTMKDERTRLVAFKRKRRRFRKEEDGILTYGQGENFIDIGCNDPPHYLPEKLGNKPLRCVFVGLNPSEVAWQLGE